MIYHTWKKLPSAGTEESKLLTLAYKQENKEKFYIYKLTIFSFNFTLNKKLYKILNKIEYK